MGVTRDPTHAERELLDTVERGGRVPAGRTAVHMHLSQLLPSNRTPANLKMAASLFLPVQSANSARVFRLSSGDIIIVGKDMPEDELDKIVNRIRSLFHDDPLAWSDDIDDDEDDPFVSWYTFEVDFPAFLALTRSILDEAEDRRKKIGLLPPEPDPIQPGDLTDMVEALEHIRIRRNIYRQPCVRISDGQASILFEEFFVSIASIMEKLAPGRDLLSERWLFQDFSRSLDRYVISTLVRSDVANLPRRISLNLNLETLHGKEYDILRRSMDLDRNMAIEVQTIDVFNNLDMWINTRRALRNTGDFLIIDGLTPPMGGVMNLGMLDPDYVKISWSPELTAPQHPTAERDMKNVIEAVGPERVIMARCDSQLAITWGLELGIQHFQGRFVDAIHGAMTMRECPASAQCTLRDCTGRRSALDTKVRNTCPHIPGLDAVQTFSAPAMGGKKKHAPSQGMKDMPYDG